MKFVLIACCLLSNIVISDTTVTGDLITPLSGSQQLPKWFRLQDVYHVSDCTVTIDYPCSKVLNQSIEQFKTPDGETLEVITLIIKP